VLKGVLSDVDGTLTDRRRRINTRAIGAIRDLVDNGAEVVLASGNTSCFMDALCRMIGTSGTFIAENGGVYRVGYRGELQIDGDQKEVWEAFRVVQENYRKKGIELELASPQYRYADLAIYRTVPVPEVQSMLEDRAIQVIDTGFAIHLQSCGVNKGTAFGKLAADLGVACPEFLAVGDAINDVCMLELAGIGAVPGNADAEAKARADYTAEKEYGDGFVEIIQHYYSYFFERTRSTTI
jgi:phosphoglycolate phosphatase